MRPLRVLLADDHALVRAGFRSLLESIPGVKVVAEANDGRQALQLIQAHRPEVVLMDIAMKDLNGIEATVRVTREFPHVRVIILSMHAQEEYVYKALRAGAAGYLLKDAGTAELKLALEAVSQGESYLSPPVSRHVISDYMRRVGNDVDPLAVLTPRQRETLQLIAEGRSTKAIAAHLHISVKTAEAHRSQLMERLDIHDVAGLVRFAIRVGLLPPEH